MPDIRTVADVQVKVRSRGLSQQGFGTMAVLFESNDVSWRTQRVTKLSEVSDLHAAFGEFSPVYIEARDAFSQEPSPPVLVLIRKATAESISTAMNAAEGVDNDWFGIVTTLRDSSSIADLAAWVETRSAKAICVAQTADSAALTTGASITKTLRDLARDWTAVMYHNPAVQTAKLTFADALVTGNSLVATVNGTALAAVPWNTSNDQTLADLATALAATAAIGTATVTSVSGTTEDNREIVLVAADNKTNMVVSIAISGGASITSAKFEKVSGGAEASAAAWMASRLVYEPGATTWKFGLLKGITPDTITASQQAALELYNANHYLAYGSTSLPAQGTMASGEWIDVKHGVAWIQVTMQTRLFNLAQSVAPKKIPFTDAGIQQTAKEVRAVLREATDKGILSDSNTVVPKVDGVSPSDKAIRKLSGITFTGTLAGAVHSFLVTGEVGI